MKKQARKPKTSSPQPEAGSPPNDDLQEQIRRRAYELWEQGGYEHGHDLKHWRQAERELADGNSK